MKRVMTTESFSNINYKTCENFIGTANQNGGLPNEEAEKRVYKNTLFIIKVYASE